MAEDSTRQAVLVEAVSEPKPLTKEERAQYERETILPGIQPEWRADIERLLAAADFWRSAVKNADVCGEIGVPCPWCGARTYDSHIMASHHYGCEYLKARE